MMEKIKEKLQEPKCIKTASRIALILFVIIMVFSILCLIEGCGIMIAAELIMDQNANADIDPLNSAVSGWAILGSAFSSALVDMLGALAVGIGFCGVIVDLIIYAPALIGKIIYKKTANLKVYWCCMAVWAAIFLFGAIILLVEGGSIL